MATFEDVSFDGLSAEELSFDEDSFQGLGENINFEIAFEGQPFEDVVVEPYIERPTDENIPGETAEDVQTNDEIVDNENNEDEKCNEQRELNESEKLIQYFARIGLLAAYLKCYEDVRNTVVSFEQDYDEMTAVFNRSFLFDHGLNAPIRIMEIKELPISLKNRVPKIQVKGCLDSIGEFAGCGITITEARDKAYYYIFKRLHRLYLFFSHAHYNEHLSDDEYYQTLVDIPKTVRIVECFKNSKHCHSIVVVDCRQFLGKSEDETEARNISIKQLRKFTQAVNTILFS